MALDLSAAMALPQTEPFEVPLTATAHAKAVAVAVLFLRDVMWNMNEAVEDQREVGDRCAVDTWANHIKGWTQRLDFLANIVSRSNDTLINALQRANITDMETAAESSAKGRAP